MSDYQAYCEIKFTQPSYELIKTIDDILATYSRKGMPVTVRQLYYRLVTKNVIVNSVKSYKKLVKLVTDARMAGLLDWDAIEDRHRAWQRRQGFESGKHFIDAVANSYHMDMWHGQAYRPFVLIEKDALSNVFASICWNYDVPLLVCKGYLSASTSRDFAITDMRYAIADGQQPIVLHFGDHDPSGIDMSRDLAERLARFLEIDTPELRRRALNLDQVKRWNPPPNPAKQTDSRYAAYVKRFGRKCWELDALEPEELQRLVRTSIERMIDRPVWERRKAQIEATSKRIRKFAAKFKG